MNLKNIDLNEQQLQASTHEGNVYVVGNPGTGKTTLILGRIVYLLDKGIKPEDILCMTFTIKATEELRERIIRKLGKTYPNVADIRVETFHSFSLNSVKEYLEQTGRNTKVIKEGLQRFLLYKVIKKLNIFDYSDDYLVTIAIILSSKLSYLKSFGLKKKHDPEKILKNLEKIMDKKKVENNRDKIIEFIPFIPKIIEEYEKEKAKYGIDYTDMLLYFKEYLEKEPIHFEHVIVDELQDSNELQADIVLKLSEKGIRFVVGDRKQSIFRFQGASVNTFERFEKDAKKFILTKNYRSTNEILDYSKTYLIQKTGKYSDEVKELSSEQKGKTPLIIDTEDYQSVTLHLIDEYLKEGKEVSVIARTNAQLMEIANILDHFKRSYSISGMNNSTSKYIKDSILAMMDVLINDNIKSFITVISSPFVNISFKEVVEVKDYIQQNKIENITDLRKLKQMKYFFKIYDSFNKEQKKMYKAFGILFNEYLLPSAITLGKDQFLTTNAIYNSIIDFFEDSVIQDHADMIEYVKISSEVFETLIGQEDSRIKLFTVHASKGKEFDAVIYLPATVRGRRIEFIEFAFDGMILDDFDISEDLKFEENKIDFVAFTRAKTNLVVVGSEAKYYFDGVSESFDPEKLDNLKTVEIDSNVELFNRYSEIIPLLESCKYGEAIEKINELKEKRPFQMDWLLGYINNIRRNTSSYSFSKISPFLECPRQYLFGVILNLRAFEGTTGAQEFGIKVHKTLEKIIKEKITDLSFIKDPEVLIAVQNAQKCDLDMLEKLKFRSFDVIGTEKEYEVAISSLIGKDCNCTIVGKIDKVLRVGNSLVVVDYKTNSSADSDPLQLHLYRYLYSNAGDHPPESIKGAFYYVYLRENPVGENPIRTHKCHFVRDSDYNTKMVELRGALEQLLFGDPKIFLEKNESKCERCPFSLLCQRLDYEIRVDINKNC